MKQLAIYANLLATITGVASFTLPATSISFVQSQQQQRPCTIIHVSEDEGAEAPLDVESDGTAAFTIDTGDSEFTTNTEKTTSFKFNSSSALRIELLDTAKTLTEESPTGIFLTAPKAIEEFTAAASRLEAITPNMTQRQKEMLVGDWRLVATTRKPSNLNLSQIQQSLPFKLKTLPKLNDAIRNSITVLQRIRSDGSEDTGDINRIDNVISYTPLTLADIVPENSPLSAIRNWNVNPLDVSRGKVALVHNANVESIEPALRTKLGLKSVIVNVAGKSQYLEANGADVLGLNIPSLSDFANGGSFDTTYIDENVRISRGKVGLLDELRVFVKDGFDIDSTLTEDEVEETTILNEEDAAAEEEVEVVEESSPKETKTDVEGDEETTSIEDSTDTDVEGDVETTSIEDSTDTDVEGDAETTSIEDSTDTDVEGDAETTSIEDSTVTMSEMKDEESSKDDDDEAN